MKNWILSRGLLFSIILCILFWIGVYNLAFGQVINNQLQVYTPPPPPAPIYVPPAPVQPVIPYGGGVDNTINIIINNNNQQSQ